MIFQARRQACFFDFTKNFLYNINVRKRDLLIEKTHKKGGINYGKINVRPLA